MTGVALSTTAALIEAAGRASSIRLAAYTLGNRRLADALEAAAARGAQVRIVLARAPNEDPAGAIAARNAATVGQLRSRGVDAALSDPAHPSPHLKAAVVDGVAYLDDANFRTDGAETVVRDPDPADVAAIEAVMNGGDDRVFAGALRLRKRDALADEAATIAAGAGHAIAVESESFGSGSFVYGALKARALAHDPVRLLVAGRELRSDRSGRERAALRTLAAAGVDVRVTDSNEKLAVAGGGGWVGSANATFAGNDEDDWGLSTRDPATVEALRERFARNWEAARALDTLPVAPGPKIGVRALDAEKLARGAAGRLENFFERELKNVGELLGALRHERGLVAFPAVRDGGEVGTVGL